MSPVAVNVHGSVYFSQSHVTHAAHGMFESPVQMMAFVLT